MFQNIMTVGEAVGHPDRAASLVHGLRLRVDAVRARVVRRRERPRVAFLEWADPPISGGHWNPELVELAGGRDGLGTPGQRSRVLAWEEIVAWRPEVMVLACCGFDEGSGRVHVVDGVRLFSRPGPSLVDSLELLAALLA